VTTTVRLGSWAERIRDVHEVERELADNVRADVDPFVPFRVGDLAGTIDMLDIGSMIQIRYSMQYAHYVFIGVAMAGNPRALTGTPLNYFHGKHSEAGADWVERAKAQLMPSWESFVLERLTS
jgi:hypothetical protein